MPAEHGEVTMRSNFESEYFTLQEVAAYLRISVTTLHRRIKDGQLEATKIGHLWRVRHDSLLTFLERMSDHHSVQWRPRSRRNPS
jgi:excisionase family DNA binding protein